MVRENDGVSTLSVVPLLQERFRQLQRMKEMRQEKELLRMLSHESERSYNDPYNNYEAKSNMFSGSQLRLFLDPPKPHCQLSLSLTPDSFKHVADSRGNYIMVKAPPNLISNPWIDHNAPLHLASLPNKLDDQNSAAFDHIDTSLRL